MDCAVLSPTAASAVGIWDQLRRLFFTLPLLGFLIRTQIKTGHGQDSLTTHMSQEVSRQMIRESGGAQERWGGVAEHHGPGDKSALCLLLQSLFNQFL